MLLKCFVWSKHCSDSEIKVVCTIANNPQNIIVFRGNAMPMYSFYNCLLRNYYVLLNALKHMEGVPSLGVGNREDLTLELHLDKCIHYHGQRRHEERYSKMETFRRSQQVFSRKSQIVNILGFLGHLVSVAIFQLCYYSVKATTDNS